MPRDKRSDACRPAGLPFTPRSPWSCSRPVVIGMQASTAACFRDSGNRRRYAAAGAAGRASDDGRRWKFWGWGCEGERADAGGGASACSRSTGSASAAGRGAAGAARGRGDRAARAAPAAAGEPRGALHRASPTSACCTATASRFPMPCGSSRMTSTMRPMWLPNLRSEDDVSALLEWAARCRRRGHPVRRRLERRGRRRAGRRRALRRHGQPRSARARPAARGRPHQPRGARPGRHARARRSSARSSRTA